MSTPTKGSSTPTAKSTSKSAKQSKKVVLHLPSKLLAKFPSDSKPTQSIETPTVVKPESDTADNKSSEDNGTPLPPGTPGATDDKSLAPPEGGKKKGILGAKAGTKRSSLTPADGSKGKGRPGPKKKPRLADGTIDRTVDGGKKVTSFAVPAPITAGHKLGPKANTGAINAGLRALDRSGKPCRKWGRKGFELKSFTGVAWGVGTWTAPQRDPSTFSGDVKSDSSSTGDAKPVMESSALPSERSSSDAAAAVPQPNGAESPPAPVAA